MNNNSNNSQIDWRKQLLDTVWKSAMTKAKFLSTASSQDHPSTYAQIENHWKKWTSSNAWIHTNQQRKLNKGSKDQIGISTFSHENTSNTMEKQGKSYPQVTYNVNSAQSRTLIADLERRIQVFENKCHIEMIGIPYREYKTNKYVWQQVKVLAAHQ